MGITRPPALALAVTTVLAAAVAGCGGDNKSSPSTSSSSSAASSSSPAASGSAPSSTSFSAAPPDPNGMAPSGKDYTALLIKASDIAPDLTSRGTAANPGGGTGAIAAFDSPDGNRHIFDLIYVYADPSGAVQSVKDVKDGLNTRVDGAPQPIDVGTNGIVAAGLSPDKSKAVTIVVFVEKTAFVELEFNSPPNDPAAQDFVLDVARKQDAAVKSGLPG